MHPDPELLPRDVQTALTTRGFGRRMYYLPEVDSTNRLARELARAGEGHGTLVATDFQTAGRGRRDHRWSSPPHRDLLFSLILRPDLAPADVLPVTLAFSLAVAETLSALLEADIGVKWPNDVVSSRGKICGILSESSTRAGHTTFVIVGMGVNVNTRPEELPGGPRAQAASCYSVSGVEHDRRRLLARLLTELERTYRRFIKDGFGAFVGRYVARLLQMNEAVTFVRRGRRSSGRVVGVQDDGGLVIRTRGGRVTVYDEEVTLE